MKLANSFLTAALAFAPVTPAAAALYSWSGLDLAVPDGTPVGVADTRLISTPLTEIQSVEVSLTLSAGYVGDLYAILIHEDTHAVLLNRAGRRPDDTFGYLDAGGLDVTFADNAANGDVHTYRLTLSGDHTTPLSGPLTGPWQPDGRTTDPSNTLLSDPRTATLSAFNGHNPNGAWTLFVADLSAVGEATLESWSLEISAVPEPEVWGWVTGLGLLAGALWFRRASRP